MTFLPCPLAEQARRCPGAAALIAGGRAVSYADWYAGVCRVQEALRGRGFGPGDRAALWGAPSPGYLTALWALWQLGAIAVPLSPRLPAGSLETLLRDLKISQVLTFSGGTSPCSFAEVIDGDHLAKGGAGAGLPAPDLELSRPATILLTSGSTGTPKAVVHSFGNHYFNALGSNQNLPLGAGDRWLLSLPFYHVSGLGILMRCVLAGAAVALPGQVDPAGNLEAQGITHLSAVSTQLLRLMDSPRGMSALKGLKAVLLGGSAIPPDLMRRARAAQLPLYVSYGLTETASQVATSRRLDAEPPGEVSARVLEHREVRIAADGEIEVRGEVLFLGYEQSGRLARPLTPDGWFSTGDMGAWAPDGGLRVTGRKDNMFISGGENIYPEEIERCLLTVPGVEQALVVPVPDPQYGARPVAFIKGKGISAADLQGPLREGLESFKIPRAFYVWPPESEGLKPRRGDFLVRLEQGAVEPWPEG